MVWCAGQGLNAICVATDGTEGFMDAFFFSVDSPHARNTHRLSCTCTFVHERPVVHGDACSLHSPVWYPLPLEMAPGEEKGRGGGQTTTMASSNCLQKHVCIACDVRWNERYIWLPVNMKKSADMTI